MYENIEIINQQTHHNKALKELNNFSHLQKITNTPISFNEFYEACCDYPIVFAKDANNQWFATVVLGINDKNLYVNETFQWKKDSYLPATLRKYPFILIKSDENEDENLTLGIDGSMLEELDETNATRAFFNNDGTTTPFAQDVMKFLVEHHHYTQATTALISDLESWDLLVEQKAIIVDANGNSHTLDGFFIVNEEKMAQLTDKKKTEICKKGAIPLITAHLISLGNIRRLGN